VFIFNKHTSNLFVTLRANIRYLLFCKETNLSPPNPTLHKFYYVTMFFPIYILDCPRNNSYDFLVFFFAVELVVFFSLAFEAFSMITEARMTDSYQCYCLYSEMCDVIKTCVVICVKRCPHKICSSTIRNDIDEIRGQISMSELEYYIDI